MHLGSKSKEMTKNENWNRLRSLHTLSETNLRKSKMAVWKRKKIHTN